MLINIMSRFGRNLETESKVLWISVPDLDLDWIRSVVPYPDPDMGSGSGYGIRIQEGKMKNSKKLRHLMF